MHGSKKKIGYGSDKTKFNLSTWIKANTPLGIMAVVVLAVMVLAITLNIPSLLTVAMDMFDKVIYAIIIISVSYNLPRILRALAWALKVIS